jgi:hypothetical protein
MYRVITSKKSEAFLEKNPRFCISISYASGSQGALFEKTAPWTPTKTFY